MCLICVELAKAKMTSKEARSALREMSENMDRGHRAEVEQQIAEREKQEASKP